jgi:hypothetical protein
MRKLRGTKTMPRKTMSRLIGALVACGLLFAVLAPSAFAQFGIASFDGEVTRNAAGDPDTQAGSHPYAVSTTINFNLRPGKEKGTLAPDGNVKDVDVELPAGLIGDPSATPQCSSAQFAGGFNNSCPENTQVGTTSLTVLGGKTLTFPVFNLKPPPGVPALFGFIVIVDPVTATATVRPAENGGTEGYGLDIHLENISQGLPLEGTSLTFWGNPSDKGHDLERGACLNATQENSAQPPGGCPYRGEPKPFMTLPTSCTGPQTTRLHVTAWTGEEDSAAFTTHGKAGEPLGADGCNLVPFDPSITTALDSGTADSPSGLAVNVHIPQNKNPEGLASANLKSTVVTLPAGISINPSTANGLVGCSVAQFDQFSEAASTCPQNSKIGTVGIDTPLLPVPIEGGIYLARQTENPFGTLIAIYLVGEADGVRVKLPGKIELDPSTGRLVTTFDNTPQVPFSDFKLHFFSGPSAVLATPVVCGTQASTASLTSWSGGAPVASGSSVTVDSAPNGGSCPTSANQRPFGISLEAGTQSNAAATHSSFALQVNRPDGNQEIAGIDATLPKGLLARLKGTPECSDADAAAGTCGAASQVGTVTVGAGAGTSPFYVKTGRAYLTGPYKGAPIGLDFVVPAVAGPLDLGTVNVRAAAFVDPETAQVMVKSDELPHILDGIPLRLRSVRIDVDKDGFMLNPTSCDPTKVTSHVTSTEGATADLADRFQAAGCNQLGFKPTVAPKLLGGRKAAQRRAHPQLQVTVKEPKGQANVSSVSFSVPKKILLDQGHIKTVCTRVQFAAQKCPAASVYGTAKVTTPLLDKPLQGPVYLRSSNNKLPDLVVDLKGQFEIVLDGRIDNKGGGIRTVFNSVPDAPISTFTLTMKGGKRGLLVNSVNLCKQPAKAVVKTTGQNGAVHNFNPALATACGGKKGKKK